VAASPARVDAGEAAVYVASSSEVTYIVLIGDVREDFPADFHRVTHRLRLEYSIECSPAGVSATTTTLTYTTAPLTVGTTYTFTIRAIGGSHRRGPRRAPRSSAASACYSSSGSSIRRIARGVVDLT